MVLITVIVVFLGAGRVTAQTSTGTVLGVVTDQSGAAIPGADVALQSTTTGVKRTTQSLQAGNFEFPFVLPDAYLLTVTKSGFGLVTVNNVIVRVNETNAQNVQMSVGA
jgi:hypothetical protein